MVNDKIVNDKIVNDKIVNDFMDKQELRKLIAIWFEEDIRDGDHTSLSCILPRRRVASS